MANKKFIVKLSGEERAQLTGLISKGKAAAKPHVAWRLQLARIVAASKPWCGMGAMLPAGSGFTAGRMTAGAAGGPSTRFRAQPLPACASRNCGLNLLHISARAYRFRKSPPRGSAFAGTLLSGGGIGSSKLLRPMLRTVLAALPKPMRSFSSEVSRDTGDGSAASRRNPGHPVTVAPARYCRAFPGNKLRSLTCIDRNNHHLDEVLEKRTKAEVLDRLEKLIEPGTVLCSDDFQGYAAFAGKVGADHRIIERSQDTWLKKAIGHAPRQKGALGLGRVNSHHQAMETLVNRILRGVSTQVFARLSHHAAHPAPPACKTHIWDRRGDGFALRLSSHRLHPHSIGIALI